MIVKLQRPLNTQPGDPNAKALIYNKDRSFEKFVPMTEDIAILMGNDDKQFWECNLQIGPDPNTPDGEWEVRGWLFKDQVEDQGW